MSAYINRREFRRLAGLAPARPSLTEAVALCEGSAEKALAQKMVKVLKGALDAHWDRDVFGSLIDGSVTTRGSRFRDDFRVNARIIVTSRLGASSDRWLDKMLETAKDSAGETFGGIWHADSEVPEQDEEDALVYAIELWPDDVKRINVGG